MAIAAAAVIVPLGILFFVSGLIINLIQVFLFIIALDCVYFIAYESRFLLYFIFFSYSMFDFWEKIHEISVYSILDMFHYPSKPKKKKKKTHLSLIEQSLFAEHFFFFFAWINLVVLSCYLRSTLSCFTWIFSSGNLLRPYSAIVEEYI